MSSTTISALPNIPLQNIFKRLSLTDQIHGVRLVCVGWRALLQTELDRRRTLVLTHDDDQNESLNALREDTLHCHDMLQHVRLDDGSPKVTLPSWKLPTLEQLKYDFVPFKIAIRGSALLRALPGITNLTVVYKNISPPFLKKVIRMLYHWSDTLVSLTFDLENIIKFKKDNDVTLLSMFEAIDQLKSLRHLKFNLTRADGGDHFVCYMPYPKLEFVSRLSTMCIKDGINPEWLFHALKYVGTKNDNLRQICCHFYFGIYGEDLFEYDLEPRLDNYFTSLHVNELQCSIWNERQNQRMQRFCTRFGSLTTLTLDIEPSALFGLAQHLGRLQHLVTLKLNISKCPDEDRMNNRAGFVDGWPILEESEPPQFQVPSVRLLDLYLDTVSHENIAALHIPSILPSLQMIRLLHRSSKCSICEYNYWPLDALDNEMKDKISKCMRLARQGFRRCAHLHTIEYNQDPSCYPNPSFRVVSPPEW